VPVLPVNWHLPDGGVYREEPQINEGGESWPYCKPCINVGKSHPPNFNQTDESFSRSTSGAMSRNAASFELVTLPYFIQVTDV
jgi:hypothetical protein